MVYHKEPLLPVDVQNRVNGDIQEDSTPVFHDTDVFTRYASAMIGVKEKIADTASQNIKKGTRTMTVSYIMDNLTTMRQVSPNIAEHLHTSNMISLGTWGTEVEIFALATILNATVYVYSQLVN